MEKWLDNNGLADLHRAGFATDRLQRPVELSVDLRVEHALRDELAQGQGQIQGQGGLRPRLQRQDRRDRGDGVAARLRSEQSEARPTIPIASTA